MLTQWITSLSIAGLCLGLSNTAIAQSPSSLPNTIQPYSLAANSYSNQRSTRNYYQRTGVYGRHGTKRVVNYYSGASFYPTYGFHAYQKPYTQPRKLYTPPYYYRTYYYPTNRARHYKHGRPTSYRYGHYRYPTRGHYAFWPVVNYHGPEEKAKYYYYPKRK